jgi:hypothetical protein
MAKFLVTVRDVRPFNHQYGTSGYYTFVGSVQSIARHLTENEHEVLVASLPVEDDSVKILLEAGYQEKT